MEKSDSFKTFQNQFKQDIFPLDWVNPKPSESYDLLILGGGPGGMTAATVARSTGARVALVEKEHLGGECLSYGCIPSKALLRSSRVIQEMRRASDHGVQFKGGWKVDFAAVMQRVHDLQKTISPHDAAEHFKHLGIDVFLGKGNFTGPNTLEVANQSIRFKKAIIATGTEALLLNIPGLDPSDYLTNQNVFNLSALPPRLAVIGAGPISCELSQAFLRFGSQVTLITRGEHLLSKDDLLATERLEKVFIDEGMKIIKRSHVVKVEKKGKEKIVYLDSQQEPFVVDEILVAIGRKPSVEGMGLEKAGVTFDLKKGIETNPFLQTSNPNIYAAGDVASPYKFTHTSTELCTMAVSNALNGNRENKSTLFVPWCTYTDPEVAHIGLSEEEAAQLNIPFETALVEMKDIDRAVLDGETIGFAKLLVRENTNEILGATLMASHAGEMISEVSVAMQSEKGLSAILHAIHPFPTQTQVLRSVSAAIMKKRKSLVSA